MRKRLKWIKQRLGLESEAQQQLPPMEIPLGYALRRAFRRGYGAKELRADILAGITVGIVALPLSMALAIAVGVAPQYGLYTAIVGGAVVALLGGSKVQVSGPTAAFVVILAPVVQQHGLAGLLLATVLAGLMLVVFGVARMGRLIQFIPDPVVTGFTTGIAIVIATLQVKDFFGLTLSAAPEHFAERVSMLAGALPTLQWAELTVALFTLLLLLLWPRILPRIPAPLVALALASLAAEALKHFGAAEVRTIGTTFHYIRDGLQYAGIPSLPPSLQWPWHAGDGLALTFSTLNSLLPAAFAIATLGAIESLLSAVVADGMAGTQHDPDGELLAQGVGNVIAPFFGGFACTGALARTATNIRAGARSPIAAITHSLFILAAVLLLAPLLSYLPMASFAALLLVVAWNMSDVSHFAHIVRVAPRSDVAVLLACCVLTVFFDMVVAIGAAMVLASLLFIRRMAEVSGARLIDDSVPTLRGELPAGVLVYEIHGPLFFGAASKAMSSLAVVGADTRVLVLDVRQVPVIDSTGLVNLESMLQRLAQHGTSIVISGLQEQPARSLKRAGIVEQEGVLYYAADLEQGLEMAQHLTAKS